VALVRHTDSPSCRRSASARCGPTPPHSSDDCRQPARLHRHWLHPCSACSARLREQPRPSAAAPFGSRRAKRVHAKLEVALCTRETRLSRLHERRSARLLGSYASVYLVVDSCFASLPRILGAALVTTPLLPGSLWHSGTPANCGDRPSPRAEGCGSRRSRRRSYPRPSPNRANSYPSTIGGGRAGAGRACGCRNVGRDRR
jgi:hypothetical protein